MRLVNTKRVLVAGFGSIFILMVLIAIIATNQMSLTFESIGYIVKKNNAKTTLISLMLVAARERTISLQNMVRLEDPFERDDEWMRFNGYGAKFANARKDFMELGISDEEEAILKAQGSLTGKVASMQLKIADLAMQEEIEEAEKLLISGAIPGQDLVFVQLYHLLNIIEEESNLTVLNVSEQLDTTKQTLLTAIVIIMLGGLAVSFVVIQQISLTERKLSREKERAQVTLHSIGDAVVTTDANGCINYMNGVAEELTGVSLEQVLNKKVSNAFAIYSDKKERALIDPLLDVILNRTTHNSDGHALLVQSSSVEYAIEYTASPIWDKNTSLTGAVLVFRDVTEMRAMALQLGYQASHDELTGLINRREFEKQVEFALMSSRGENLIHTMCYLDLDQFKVVNDTCGHVAGDELLRQVTVLLKANIRTGDTLARLGGDEFGILYLNCTVDKAKELANKLRIIIHDFHFSWEGKSFSIGVSIGLVAMDKHSNLHNLLSAADTACYVAKDEGRNRIHCFNDHEDALTERTGQMQWVHKITLALEEERFRVYCQKMLSFDETWPTHFEVLVRMVDEEGAIVPPMAFLPAAERFNLMGSIDRWMVKNTFQAIARLLDSHENRNLLFAINLSAQSLCDDDFLPYVQDQLIYHKLEPSLICFEITETSAIVNLTRAQHFMATLKKLGCYFSLDDFGSGLSSFSYLKNLKVDYLKIDGAFVRDIVDDKIDKALVESINQVGHVMGIKTIAEFVENAEILAEIRKIGIDIAQGYEIARPIPIEDIQL